MLRPNNLVLGLLAAAAILVPSPALGQAVLMTSADQSGFLYNYSIQPLAFTRSYEAGPRILRVLPHPNGQRIYVVSEDPNRGIVTMNRDFLGEAVPPKNNLGSIRTAELTPDGTRLLVLAGSLRVFRTDGNEAEVTTAGGIGVDIPEYLAVSLDSRRAYVLSPTSNRLYGIDLTSLAQLPGSPVTIPGTLKGMAVGPNGRLYIISNTRFFEIDGRTLAIRGETTISANPSGKIAFSPDGLRAYVLNAAAVGTQPILIFNLETRALAGGAGVTGQVFTDIIPITNNRALALSGERRLFLASTDGGPVTEVSLNVGSLQNVRAVIPSNEVSDVRTVFIADAETLYRVDAPTFTVTATTALNTPPGIGSVYFPRTATGSAASVFQYNGVQNVKVGTISLPLVLRIVNSLGEPLPNVTVTFQSLNPSAPLSATAGVSNPLGYVETAVTAPAGLGEFQVQATVPGFAPFTFTLNAVEGGGSNPTDPNTPVPGAPRIVSGNGQVVASSSRTPQPLVVRVVDAQNRPIPNVPVAWSAGSDASIPNNSNETFTDETGTTAIYAFGATFIPGNTFVRGTVVATTPAGSATFFLTTLGTQSNNLSSFGASLNRPDIATGRIQGKVGETLVAPFEVNTYTFSGNTAYLSNVGIEVSTPGGSGLPTATCANGGGLTNEQGNGTCNVILGGTPGEATLTILIGGQLTYRLPLTVLPGDPAIITPINGDNVTREPGQTVALIARVTDAGGNLSVGANVAWQVLTPNGGTVSSATGVTNSAGQVNTTFTAGQINGPVRIRASSGTGTYEFTVTVNLRISNLTVVSGNNQTAVTNSPFSQPLTVRVTDPQGNGVPGVPVTFSVTAGQVTLAPLTVSTDPQGNATTNATAGPTAGAATVRATVLTLTRDFNLTIIPPAPVFTAANIRNWLSGETTLAPGSLARLTGTNLIANLNGAITSLPTGPWPTTVNGVSVTVAGVAAPIYQIANYNNEQSIIFQVPFETPVGTAAVSVTTPTGTAGANVTIAQVSPGLLETTVGTRRYAVLVKPNGTLVSPTNPANRGEILRAYFTGLGATTPAVPTNTPGSGGQLVAVEIFTGVNNEGVRTVSAEYAENLIGMYVVTFEVPLNAQTGADVPFGLGVRLGGQVIFSNGSVIPAVQ
ncbi:MAG: Ig-like domain-containing protein [Bryobacteraceae bacterium]|nr:Ig-like domain-containing protein [Bryobacteraceae bacterium]